MESKNKYLLFLFVAVILSSGCLAQTNKSIKLLVRADDIASFHDANIACIKSATNGIARSVEIMVPCAWFPEAVKMLNQNPAIDVGIHLVLTSEWETIKWRPLTSVPSLVDRNGYFFPFIWKFGTDTLDRFLNETSWKIEEIEKELRAQIKLGLKHLPQTSHLSAHMGFTSLAPKVAALVTKLAHEYHLKTEGDIQTKRFRGWENDSLLEQKVKQFITNIEQLTPGNYLFVEHPGLDGPEMQAVKGNVAINRQHVTDIFTHPEVKKALLKKGVQLVSYNDLF